MYIVRYKDRILQLLRLIVPLKCRNAYEVSSPLLFFSNLLSSFTVCLSKNIELLTKQGGFKCG